MVSGFHHASLLIADLRRSLEFYQGILGLELNINRPALGYPGAWLNVSSQQIHLIQLPNPDPTIGRPLHAGHDRHLALTVSNIDQLRTALSDAGVSFTSSRSGRPALFCRDPDGNGLEFIQTP
jgi:glyoxylase I family protein